MRHHERKSKILDTGEKEVSPENWLGIRSHVGGGDQPLFGRTRYMRPARLATTDRLPLWESGFDLSV